MESSVVDDVWEEMRDQIGNDLRFVVQYDRLDVESRVREDVQSLYTEAEGEELVQETIVDQMTEVELGRKRKTGDLEALVRVFEDAWLVSWVAPGDWKRGLSVSIDRDGSEATIEEVQSCIDFLTDDVRPGLLAG